MRFSGWLCAGLLLLYSREIVPTKKKKTVCHTTPFKFYFLNFKVKNEKLCFCYVAGGW